jgi:hypothetical protein
MMTKCTVQIHFHNELKKHLHTVTLTTANPFACYTLFLGS